MPSESLRWLLKMTHELCEEACLFRLLLIAQELVKVILKLQGQWVVVTTDNFQHLEHKQANQYSTNDSSPQQSLTQTLYIFAVTVKPHGVGR